MLKYKNFLGKEIYDDEAKILHGEVVGINDVITFQAKDADTIEEEFKSSVDDYLAFCEEEGPLLVSKVSQAKDISMNDWLNEAIDEKIKKEVS